MWKFGFYAGLRVAVVLAAAAEVSAGDEVRWQGLRPPIEGSAALAFDPASGWLAIGDARGVRIGTPGVAWRRAGIHGPVRDLAFAGPAGPLWVATDAGLFRVTPALEVRRVAAAPGSEARDVRRIAALAEAVAVATGDGVYISLAGDVWQPVSRHWPRAPATAVALKRTEDGFACWAVIERRLWQARLSKGGREIPSARAGSVVLPAAPSREPPVDVHFSVGESDTVIVYPDALAMRERGSGSWVTLRPTLAPGAGLLRIAAAADALWLATDRGLWIADKMAGPWRRAAVPIGTRAVEGIASDGERLFVSNSSGVSERRVHAVGRRATREAAGAASRERPREPDIALVHREVLAHLDLGPQRARALRRGVSLRGWLPLVGLRVGVARDSDRDVDYDDAFVSGDTRHLVDRNIARRRDFDAALTLSWDLGDVAYHPESIDVSKEAREVLKLRDDVLDEVNQLYFERLRVRAELAEVGSALAPEERLRLELREAELAAGLDAWTGGWFRRAAAQVGP